MRRGSKIRSSLVAGTLLVGALAITAPHAGADNIGNEGCTPGYWKNHTSNWEEYSPNQKMKSITLMMPAGFTEVTFLQALNFGGGTGISGATRILLRATAAAFLNAAHEGVGYPYRRFSEPGNLQADVNAALTSQNRNTMLALAAELDQANNLGCPL